MEDDFQPTRNCLVYLRNKGSYHDYGKYGNCQYCQFWHFLLHLCLPLEGPKKADSHRFLWKGLNSGRS